MRHDELMEKLYSMTLDGPDQQCGDVSTVGRWYGTLENLRLGGEEFAIKYAIVSQDDQGFKDAETFTSKAEFEERWSAIEAEVIEAEGPTEDDYVISDDRGKESVGQYGKHLGSFDSRDEAEDFIRKQAKAAQFWPNVWTISDHGNTNLLKFDYDQKS